MRTFIVYLAIFAFLALYIAWRTKRLGVWDQIAAYYFSKGTSLDSNRDQ